MSGFLFLMVMDWIMRRTVGKGENGIRWRLTTKLDDLDFADDVALLSLSRNQMQEKTSRMDMEAKRVGQVSQEIKRRRWKFIGHIPRQDRTSDTRTALNWRPEEKRKRGRPKTTWRRTVEREMKEGGWGSWDEVQGVAVDRQTWKASVEALCATWHTEDR